MAPTVRLADAAKRDISDIFDWTHDEFGEAARARYELLLNTAFMHLCENPSRHGVTNIDGHATFKSYHIRYSATKIRPARLRVTSPRHLIIFRFLPPSLLVVARVLHDSMDILQHLSDDDASH